MSASLDTRRDVVGDWLEHGLEALLEFDADRVVETSELSLGVLDAAGEFGVLGEPSMTEPGIGLEFRDAVLGSGDPAVEVLERWWPWVAQSRCGPGLAPSG